MKPDALTVESSTETLTVSAKKPRKRKPNVSENECSQCPYCQAANRDLRDAWKEIESLKAEIQGLRNTLMLYREHLGAKEL